MKYFIHALVTAGCAAGFSAAQDGTDSELFLRAEHHVPAAVAGAAAYLLPDAEATVALSKMHDPRMRGVIGESVAERAALRYLNQNGGTSWRAVTPRVGPQGLDHVFMKFDRQGRPYALMVGETKFGTSRLSQHTKDGAQMSSTWINKRLIAMGNRYLEASGSGGITCSARPPLKVRHTFSVRLRDGSVVEFWRNSASDTWKFSGSKDELAEAQKLAGAYGKLLNGAGNGAITYRSKVFRVEMKGKDLCLSVSDPTANRTLPDEGRIFKNAVGKGGKLTESAEREIARDLQGKMNMSEKEALACAKKIGRQTTENLASTRQLLGKAIGGSAAAGTVGAALDALLQYVATDDVDWSRTAISGGVIAAGTLAPYALQYLRGTRMLSPFGSASSLLGKAGRFFAKSIPGYALVDIGISAVNALAGNGSWYDVGESAIIGASGIGASALVMAVPGWMGATAGTGAAISSLSGAAATNATLAWLGGGTVASGGGGMAIGAAVAGGIVVIAVVGVGAVCYFIKDWRENVHLREYNREMFDYYSKDKTWDKILGIDAMGRLMLP